jgi:hypothetical protein
MKCGAFRRIGSMVKNRLSKIANQKPLLFHSRRAAAAIEC